MPGEPKLLHIDVDEFFDKYHDIITMFQKQFGVGAHLSFEQLCGILQGLDGNISEANVRQLWGQIDKDGSGDVDVGELLWYLFDIDSLQEKCVYEDLKGLSRSAVYVRVRPIGADGHSMGDEVEKCLDGWTDSSVFVKDRHSNVRDEYKFPKVVLTPDATQEDTYKTVMTDPVQGWLMNSINVMLLAYGQTGTGKTHTMFGPRESLSSAEPHPDWGIFPRVAHQCLSDCRKCYAMEELHAGAAYSLRAYAMEFYFGQAYDLVGEKQPLLFNPEGEALGANFLEIQQVSDLGPFLDMVAANRTMSGTKMNAGSSRSHCALTLRLVEIGAEKKKPDDLQCLRRSLTILDMAGSERPSRAGTERIGMNTSEFCELMFKMAKGKPLTKSQQQGMEGSVINTELMLLRDEIVKAAELNQGRMKYKNNCLGNMPLLRMIGRCLVGQCWMNAIICLSQSPQNGWETWFSCEYGNDLAKLQAPLRKVKPEDAKKATTRLREAAEKAVGTLDRTPTTGPSAKYRPLRQAMVKHTADELELHEHLMAQVKAQGVGAA